MSDTDILMDTPLRHELAEAGYARLSGADLFERLPSAGWNALARSWDDLGPDLYMADGGRYRRRRHATFACEQGVFTRQPHQPHFQSRDYNPLNGDVQRWFDPVEQGTIDNSAMQAIFAFCARSFPLAGRQHVELHQFRIEARTGELGRPTPEGMHRDGVDWVFVMLVERRNVREGVTRIGTPEGGALGEFTLARPGDAVLIDDHRIMHGVTEIHAVDPAQPAWRDALVLTFAAGA
ncbi:MULTISPECIES: 2OG-Fe dioxygenase family protein [Sphingobium]|uniref:2OG-Fe dioxygenase family protein n=1 Tax=Sphingobium fuliginis (strain ATCC 27551) TaxID=336203 RepID=A0ABQ1EVR7_SPHSA|nr:MULTISPECIES: 2OG-Fe dioxygenase family protein [Sphingobium]AJR25518.1 hypothetical protein TZ53_19050 [Sphingobium sp. YBL2]RYL98813.1 hypothetical protein EWH10_09985 [Sphingobium fuliginis]UXC92043.1 2OG-Fe dioxygenase family protein [Sphingobium sp. RSMS]WDA37621.1 2OG-Fe dioxygenase family protein [Sphingobium sp. YC-XJ3]GFZ88708.1 hypothetical protein GCM10019071_17970 [Sphingobium fuliginis]